MEMNVQEQVKCIAQAAKEASRVLAVSSTEERNSALLAMAEQLRAQKQQIFAANEADVEAARKAGTKESLVDRLLLTEARLESMAHALEDLVALPDPLMRVYERRSMYNGIELERVSVPLGVVAVVYEARPNVTADAAGICLKSGNAVILRGGSLAIHSNEAIASALQAGAQQAGLPTSCISFVDLVDRSATDELMKLRGLVDVLIPRGGAGLISHCVECSQVPVIETGTGNCHVYVHSSADLALALPIIVNAKTQRTGVCNACESVLVDAGVAKAFLPELASVLGAAGVLMHGDEAFLAAAAQTDCPADLLLPATEDDWGREYLDLEISIKCVESLDEAIAHINTYGTRHSEAIIAQDKTASERFLREVDASSVYVNASTRFTDGGEFGLGAEIGISTQKLHVRGPFALEGLTSYKYLLRGTGQIRG